MPDFNMADWLAQQDQPSTPTEATAQPPKAPASPQPPKTDSPQEPFDMGSWLAANGGSDEDEPGKKVDGILAKGAGIQTGTFQLAPDGTHQPVGKPLPLPKNMPPAQTVVQAEPGAIPEGQGRKVVVTYVDDGDTFNFDPKGQKVPNAITHQDSKGNNVFTCRIDSIDAPEVDHGDGKPGQPGGPAAADYLKQMIANKEVTIKVARQDDHGRNVCQVELEGKNIDYDMVKHGLAWVIDSTQKFDDKPRLNALMQAQDQNMIHGNGIFGQSGNMEPYKWRRHYWDHSTDD